MAKTLTFDHPIVTDSGLVTGEYTPKTDEEYKRLEPHAVKAAEKPEPKKADKPE